MDQDEAEPDVANLAVKLEQRVLAERRGERVGPGHERELQPDHREPREPKRDRAVRPKDRGRVVGWRDRAGVARNQVDGRGRDGELIAATG